jgi:hypothetical protein
MRERVRQVMRYSGPKMLLRHPIRALLHLLWDGRKQAPARNGMKARTIAVFIRGIATPSVGMDGISCRVFS